MIAIFILLYFMFGLGVLIAAFASNERTQYTGSGLGYVFIFLFWPSSLMLAVMLALESLHLGPLPNKAITAERTPLVEQSPDSPPAE